MSTVADISSLLGSAAADLSAAAPYAGAITALANLGIDITKIFTPDQAQTYDQAHAARLQQAAELISSMVAHPDVDTEQRLNDFDDRLCLQSGHPVLGGVDGVTVTIRVDRLLAHYASISDEVRLQAILNDLVIAAKQPASAGTVKTP